MNEAGWKTVNVNVVDRGAQITTAGELVLSNDVRVFAAMDFCPCRVGALLIAVVIDPPDVPLPLVPSGEIHAITIVNDVRVDGEAAHVQLSAPGEHVLECAVAGPVALFANGTFDFYPSTYHVAVGEFAFKVRANFDEKGDTWRCDVLNCSRPHAIGKQE